MAAIEARPAVQRGLAAPPRGEAAAVVEKRPQDAGLSYATRYRRGARRLAAMNEMTRIAAQPAY